MTPKTIPVAPFDCVIFGGTGDLSLRKLLPALYHRDVDGQIPSSSRIFSISRKAMDAAAYRRLVEERVAKHKADDASWARFLARLDHIALDASADAGWDNLKRRLDETPGHVRVFYLATAPSLYGPTCARLGKTGLATPEARVVVEKPIGHDLASARQINEEIGKVFSERQTYRIDHYLGKETVQNLIALRFANSLFEPLWSSTWIDHVQVTVAETVGLEGRADYYDTAGSALRDMVQNHLLQLLCMVALEPPRNFDADAVRDEKIKVLRALEPIGEGDHGIIRGQYRRGAAEGKAVPGYQEELSDGKTSRTETFVALKVGIANWRWSGVPFYLHSRAAMATRTSEIVIQFRAVPHNIFPRSAGGLNPNRLVIRLQPDEGITLHLMTKEPGPGGLRLKSVPRPLLRRGIFAGRLPEAYERLLLDVVRGNPTLFMHRDEVEAAWTWLDASIRTWEEKGTMRRSPTWPEAGARPPRQR